MFVTRPCINPRPQRRPDFLNSIQPKLGKLWIDSNHDSQWLYKNWSNQLTTQNGFLKFDSNRLMTQKASRIFWFKSTHESKAFQNFDSSRLMPQTLSWILIWIKSWLNDSNQVFISWPLLGPSVKVVELFWDFTKFRWPFLGHSLSALIRISSWFKQ